MRKKSISALQRQGHRLTPRSTVSLRIEPEILERIDWAAQAGRVTRSEFIRDTLREATIAAKPPNSVEFRGIGASREEWRAWEQIERDTGESLEALIRRLLNFVLARNQSMKETI